MANSQYPKTVSFSTTVPFDQPLSYMAEYTITGALTFVKSTTGAYPGYGTMIRLVADGTHTPDFSDFALEGPGSWDNTNGVVNKVFFYYDGSQYCYIVTQPGTGGSGTVDTTPPTIVSATAIDSTTITVVFDENVTPTTSGWSVYKTEIAETSGATALTGSGTTWDFTIGGTAMDNTMTLKISYNATTGNTLDTAGNELATVSNLSVTNSIAGGGSYDTDAQTGFTYIESTLGATLTTTEKSSVSDAITALKSAGAWTKIRGFYPHVGSSAAAMGVNFKDTAKNLTLTGGATNAKGLRFAAGTDFADTGLQISNTLGSNDFGTYNIGATYSLEEVVHNCYVGAAGTTDFNLFQSDNSTLVAYPRVGNSSSGITYTGAIPTGTQTLQRKSDGSVDQLFWDSTLKGEDTNAVNSFVSDGNVLLHKYGGTTINADLTTAHFTILHQSFTSTEQGNVVTAMATFKTALSR